MNGNESNKPAIATSGSSAADPMRGTPVSRVSRDGSRVLDPGVASRLSAIPDPDQNDLNQVSAPVDEPKKAPVAAATSAASVTNESARHAAVASLAAGTPMEKAVRDGFSGIARVDAEKANAVSDVEIEDFGRSHRFIDAVINLISFRWLINWFRGSRQQEFEELQKKLDKLAEDCYENDARLGDLGRTIADQRLKMEQRIRAIVQETAPDLTPIRSRLVIMENWATDITKKLEAISKSLEASPQTQVLASDSGELKALQEKLGELDASIAGLTAEMRKETSEKIEALRSTLDATFAKMYQSDLPVWLGTQLGPMIESEIKARRALPPLDGDVADDVYAQLEMMGDDLEKFEDRLNNNEPHMLAIMRLGRDLERRLKSPTAENDRFAAGRTMIQTPLPANLGKSFNEIQAMPKADEKPSEAQQETAFKDPEAEFEARKSVIDEAAGLTQEQLDSEFAEKKKAESQVAKPEPATQVSTPEAKSANKASGEMTDEEFAEMAGLRSSWSQGTKLTLIGFAAVIVLVGFVQVARSNWFQSLAASMRQQPTVDGGTSANSRTKPPLQLESSGDPSTASRDGGVDYPLTGKTKLNSSERLIKSQQSTTPNADPSAIKPDKNKGILNEPKKKGIERKLDRLREKQSQAEDGIVKDYSKLGSVEEALKKLQQDLQDELSGKKEEEPARDLTPPVIVPKWNQPTMVTQTIAIPNDKQQSPCRLILHEGEANEECVQ